MPPNHDCSIGLATDGLVAGWPLIRHFTVRCPGHSRPNLDLSRSVLGSGTECDLPTSNPGMDDENEAIQPEGPDSYHPAVQAALDLVRWELELLADDLFGDRDL